jgi:hypothetical protein
MDGKDEAQFEMLKNPPARGFYKHDKTRALYIVYSFSIDEKTLAAQVNYWSTVKRTRWNRSFEEFFGMVQRDDGSGGLLPPVRRFTFVRPATLEELANAAGILEHPVRPETMKYGVHPGSEVER